MTAVEVGAHATPPGGRRRSVRPTGVARSTLYNLVGTVAPMAAALVAIPLLVAGLGAERFGVLGMAWGLVGYFSVLDLGLGRALTQMVAERLDTEAEADIPALAWTAIPLMLAFGLVGALAIVLPAEYLVRELLDMPPGLQAEAVPALVIVALSLPLVTSTAGLRGILEAAHRFGAVNAIRLPMGLFAFLGPLLVLPFSRSLVPVMAVLLVGRALGWFAHLIVCLRTLPALATGVQFRVAWIGPLLRFGGWMTATNVASSVMFYLDRFLIGGLLSVAAVTYYVTPYEVVWRLTLIPTALLTVLFPAFAATVTRSRPEAARLFGWGARAVYLIVFPMTLLVLVFAGDVLQLWLGPDFAAQSTPVLRWLALGVFFISFGLTAGTALQGAGFPKATAMVNLVEIPLYLAALWWLLDAYGIVGAAIAWTFRAGLDALLLLLVSHRRRLVTGADLGRIALLNALSLPMLAAGTMLESFGGRVAYASLGIAAFALFGWKLVLTPSERSTLLARLAPHARS